MQTEKLLKKILSLLAVFGIIGSSVIRFDLPGIFYYFSAAGLLLIGIVAVLNFFLTRRGGNPAHLLILPALFLFSYFALIALISGLVLKIFLGIVVAALFYLYEKHFPRSIPRVLEQTMTILTAIFLATVAWGVNFYLTPPWWIISLLNLGFFSILFWQFFLKINLEKKLRAVVSLVSALIVSEVGWGLLYWPVHFFSAAVMQFAVFYLIYSLSELHYHNRLTRRGLYFQITIVIILVILTLTSSPWFPDFAV